MGTVSWAEWGSPEPRAPAARPMRHVHLTENSLPHGHPRRRCTSPPALAAIVQPDDQAAAVTSAQNPLAQGAP